MLAEKVKSSRIITLFGIGLEKVIEYGYYFNWFNMLKPSVSINDTCHFPECSHLGMKVNRLQVLSHALGHLKFRFLVAIC